MKFFKTFRLLSLLGITLASTLAFAESVPTNTVVGKFGFNWLKPTNARCVAITDAAASAFKTCKHSDANSEGSFTGKKDYYSCQAGPNNETMIYSTQARCKEELETMQANGD